MNIKSLLLGSAAALVAVSGARAADVIVMAEPEPVEYVRVCDVYGAGFFYIPGTETCLQISGYVRYEHRYESEGNDVVVTETPGGVTPVRDVAGNLTDIVVGDSTFEVDQLNQDGDDDLWFSQARARVNFDARQETDFGTLRAYYRLQATYNDITNGISGDANVQMDRGFVQLGGFTAGYLESLWVSELGGGDLTAYAGTGLDAEYLPYGDRQVNQLNYALTAGAFNASIGVESDGTGDFETDVVAKIAYAGDFGAAWVVGAYDDSVTDGNTANGFIVDDAFEDDNDDDGFAIKAGIALQDLLVADSLLKVQGHYSFDPTTFSYLPSAGSNFVNSTITNPNSSRSPNAGIPLEYSIEAGYTQTFGQVAAGVGGIYGESFEVLGEDADYYGLEGNLVYNFTDRFFAGLFLTYEEFDFGNTSAPLLTEDDEFRGFLRIERAF